MKHKRYFAAAVALILAGISLLVLYLVQPVTLPINGAQTRVLSPRAVGVRQPVQIILWLDGNRQQLVSAAVYPSEILRESGVLLFPGDQLWVDGRQTTSSQPLSAARVHTIQVLRKNHLAANTFPDETLGLALARQGNPLFGLDTLSVSEDSPVSAQAYSIGRVQQILELTLTSLPYQKQRQFDPNRELNTETIVQTGQPGLAVNLNRVRLVNGIKTGSDASKTIQLAAAVDEILRVGTQAVVKTTTVEGTTFDYWFSAPMYATTYAPTEGGGPTTYSGQPVTHGVAAVIRAWYPAMAGQPIYVTGYGYATIEDIGGGIPGKPWIDLAYDDATYQAWSGWVTVYFLPPVAPAIIEILN